MKSLLLLLSLSFFGFYSGQKTQEFSYKFNVKKWNKSYQKLQKKSKNSSVELNLFDISGNPIQFNVYEKSISEQPMENIKIFKGKSEDDKKIISLTMLPKSMSGSYLENGQQYFIEPIKDKCNWYKVYIDPKINENVEVGQLKDFVE